MSDTPAPSTRPATGNPPAPAPTPFPSDLEIAAAATPRPIADVAADLGIAPEHLIRYGDDVAKIDPSVLGGGGGTPDGAGDGMPDSASEQPSDTGPAQTSRRGKFVVVAGVTPTPLGEGKTTVTVGLAQGLQARGTNAVATIRQPSLGPTLGIKGGAAGGGYSQVIPMEKLNLHLTGDLHAVTAAHNLLAAVVDNHLHHGRPTATGKLLDARRVAWRRVLDLNDRALRDVVVGLGARVDGVPRQTGFDITAASEVMVLLVLSSSLRDMRERLGRIVVGETADRVPVTAEDLGAAGAMAVLLQDALRPNLLQTLEGGPALVHCGPFGNIATGTSSVLADRIALEHADVVITEAGFGADMGAERCFDVKCRAGGLVPDAAVIVTTVRAMKVHSGQYRIVPGKPLPERLLEENPEEVWTGLGNLKAHIGIIRRFGVTPVVAINAFPQDHDSEHAVIREVCAELGVRCAVTRHVAQGGAGADELATQVLAALEEGSQFRYLYDLELPLVEKIERIATQVYGADGIDLAPAAARDLAHYTELGYGTLPVIIAKTPLSLSSDPSLTGAPRGWRMPVREVRAAVGAGYVYAICGDIRTMPGLPLHPNVERIDLEFSDDNTARIVGLM